MLKPLLKPFLTPLVARVKRYFASARLPLKLLNVQNTITQSARWMSVYVYLTSPSSPSHTEHQRGLCTFFDKHAQKLRMRAPQMPIFLQESLAVRHAQFRHTPYVIFKLIVPESAIMGRTQSLMIKTEAIRAESIHGCIVGSETPEIYLNNPLFAEKPVSKKVTN